jgi:opacity protein-like surface antigen
MVVKKFLGWVSLFLVTPLAFAQVARSTQGGGGSIIVGAEFSHFNPDSTLVPLGLTPGIEPEGHVDGPGLFFDVNLRPRWGAEGEARWLHWGGYGGQTQSHYLIGPRYEAYRWHQLSLWGKLLVGGGNQKFADQYGTASGSYFAFAPGATVDYRLNYRWDVRADYEYQFWPSAPGLPGFDDNGMNPHGFSLGIGYRLFTAR